MYALLLTIEKQGYSISMLSELFMFEI